jgi:hypothetical protein
MHPKWSRKRGIIMTTADEDPSPIYKAKRYTAPFSVNGNIYLPGMYSFEENRFAVTLVNEDGCEPLFLNEWNKRSRKIDTVS